MGCLPRKPRPLRLQLPESQPYLTWSWNIWKHEKSLVSFLLLYFSRNNKYNSDDFIEWDWLSKNEFVHNFEKIDVVIFFPKPSRNDESGYEDGFKNSTENLNKIISKLPIDTFISISSTRVYDKESKSSCKEIDSIDPSEFRGKIIKEYEEKQIDLYKDKLIILRFSGLYDSHSKEISKNHLHRDNAAKIIQFFIENNFYFKSKLRKRD